MLQALLIAQDQVSAAIDIDFGQPNPNWNPAVMRLALNHGLPDGGQAQLLQEFGGQIYEGNPAKRDSFDRKRLGPSPVQHGQWQAYVVKRSEGKIFVWIDDQLAWVHNLPITQNAMNIAAGAGVSATCGTCESSIFDRINSIKIRPRGTSGSIWGLSVRHVPQELDVRQRGLNFVVDPDQVGYVESDGYTKRTVLQCRYAEDGSLQQGQGSTSFYPLLQFTKTGLQDAWPVGTVVAGGSEWQDGDTAVLAPSYVYHCPACKGNTAKAHGAWDAPCA